MSYEKVSQAKQIVIGTKQTLKALQNGQANELIIAEDAELRIVNKVKLLAIDLGIPVTTVESMNKLGKACGIDVGAATVVIKK